MNPTACYVLGTYALAGQKLYITGRNLKAVLKANIHPSATIMTDDFRAYRRATKDFAAHESVNHSAREYVRGDAHTNTVEGFFSLLKRGVVGTFHHEMDFDALMCHVVLVKTDKKKKAAKRKK